MKCICVPVRDRYSLLRGLMDSLRPFEERGWNIVLGIEPGDETIQRAYRNRTPLFTLWNSKVYGIGWNHYKVLSYAFSKLNADYAMVLDADTLVLPDAINLVKWFDEWKSEYLALSLLSLRLEDTYRERAEALVECTFASRFQLTCGRDMWYKYIQPVWMRTGQWDESLHDVCMRTGLRVIHPEMSRIRLCGQNNSRVLGSEEHRRIEERLVCFEGESAGRYYLKDPVIQERR